jgi:predicted nuclease with TOPRIM domain
LDEAVGRLKGAVDKQSSKVDAAVLVDLQGQLDGLKQDNLALSEALEAYSDTDYDNQFEQMREKLDNLENENTALKETNSSLNQMNCDVSSRLEKLIGNVEQVLEGDE